MATFDQIFEQEVPEIEKLAQGFNWITSQYLETYARQIEVTRALQDNESLVKEQIKLEMVRHLRQVFNHCYYRSVGRRAWDE